MGVGFHAGSETWQTIHGSESSLLIRVAKLLNPDGKPAWVVCEDCGEMLCNIHDCHTFDGYCDCPELGVWDLIGLDPYASGGALSSEALQSLVKVVYAQTEIPF